MNRSVFLTLCTLVVTPALMNCQQTQVVVQDQGFNLDNLQQDAEVQGFRTEALYTNAQGQVMGARFVHGHTGFVFDAVNLESVPQAFVWVKSFPNSDRGEPHTQEHLLLGKGNRGRAVAGLEDMSLVRSTAYTQQWRTCYHFNTSGDGPGFFKILEPKLDALLNPDYSDVEIQREVHHFAVKSDGESGELFLEEKGTVYQEMSTTFERPYSPLWRLMLTSLYGQKHPLAMSAGGVPSAIREMTPKHIRDFHRETYQLGNMGMIGSFPSSMAMEESLAQMDALLRRLQPEATGDRSFAGLDDLPPVHTLQKQELLVAPYPSASADVPGDMVIAWPPTRTLVGGEQLLLELFLENFAGAANSNLHKRFVDAKTRVADLGATEVYGWKNDDLGQPVFLGLGGIPADRMGQELADEFRGQVFEELKAIAALPADSEALQDFNRRMAASLVFQKRQLSKLVNSPPGFGERQGGGAWIAQLHRLEQNGGFRRSLTLQHELAFVEEALAESGNLWSTYLQKWGLLTEQPLMFMNQASPEMVQASKADKQARFDAQAVVLKKQFQTDSLQEALEKFKVDYDQTTAELEEISKSSAFPAFMDSPPMGLDEQLNFEQLLVGDGQVPLVKSIFNNMTGATVGLNLDVTRVEAKHLLYLSALPSLMTEVGVSDENGVMGYDEVVERMQNEVLGVEASFESNGETGRVELSLTGSGSSLEESQGAVSWMERMLFHPDWRMENLTRIQDVTASLYTTLLGTNRRPEEHWVQDPASAYRYQDNAHYLSTQSFMTRLHHVRRLKWRLMDGGEAQQLAEVDGFLRAFVSEAKGWEQELLLNKLGELTSAHLGTGPLFEQLGASSEGAQRYIKLALLDIKAAVPELPESTLHSDIKDLCETMISDLAYAPQQALEDLNALKTTLLFQKGARMYTVGSNSVLEKLDGELQALIELLSKNEPPAKGIVEKPWIIARVNERGVEGVPVFTGLLNANSQGGVFVHSADTTAYDQQDEQSQLQYLSGLLYGGGGAHSIFMKTWGAGLAYSNGLRTSLDRGVVVYYAERSPDLPQTMSFVIDQLKGAEVDESLGEYAVAQAFRVNRAPNSYESRGAAMAANLEDGLTPERVRQFREGILRLRQKDGLATELFGQMEAVYGRVLPGYGPASSEVEAAVLMSIAPEHQLVSYQDYLHREEGPDAELVRLYARDFWLTF